MLQLGSLLHKDSVQGNSVCCLAGALLRLFQCMPFQHQLPATAGHFNWPKLWLAFCFANAVLPLCALYTWVQPKIQWSGITYRKARGCIIAVDHPDNSGLTATSHSWNRP